MHAVEGCYSGLYAGVQSAAAAPRTIDNYGKHLRYLTDDLTAEYQLEKLEEVKPAHIKKFLLMKEEQGCKPHYINDLLKVFKTFFRCCTEEENIKSNPAKRVRNVRQPKVMIRTFSEEEILKMLNHYQGNDFISVRNKAMLALFFDTGLRLTEVLELRNDQIYDGFVRVMGKAKEYMEQWIAGGRYKETGDAAQ